MKTCNISIDRQLALSSPEDKRGDLYSTQVLWTRWISVSKLRTPETKLPVYIDPDRDKHTDLSWTSKRTKKWYLCAFPPVRNPSSGFPWAPQRAQPARLVCGTTVACLGSPATSRSPTNPTTYKAYYTARSLLLPRLTQQWNTLCAWEIRAGGWLPPHHSAAAGGL